MKLSAFDYDKQRWVEGKEAYPYLLEQYNEELAILNSNKAESFVKSFMFKCSVKTAKRLVMKSIRELKEIKDRLK